ncbi:hypothetical protein H3146_04660 [Streptomyces sp. OF3]|uniref:Uncharacterized protein n=1 Tax=Streptomyces alkaliterrae TaxID=2213162 RepID=A0A7W3WHU8_9ACTN|nr:hypothetical protein [Streptomyces alkaliterrae]MBB1252662.1 hypothetical protein [Streptomyces alkaliterrae]
MQGCKPGNVCFYTNNTNTPDWQTSGSSTPGYTYNYTNAKILNNGRKWVGADHIYYFGTYVGMDGKYGGALAGCLHHYEGGRVGDSGAWIDVNKLVAYRIASATYVNNHYWGGECEAGSTGLQYKPNGSTKWYRVS